MHDKLENVNMSICIILDPLLWALVSLQLHALLVLLIFSTIIQNVAWLHMDQVLYSSNYQS